MSAPPSRWDLTLMPLLLKYTCMYGNFAGDVLPKCRDIFTHMALEPIILIWLSSPSWH